ncbi:hypothetical protein [Polynucleobacter sp. MWH-UH25E]|uniref:hypothetical protein n=1 Tax=Polynucleobacter sp. MWH-UH25E TaxID=1855616 RepID=UPI001BFEDE40|nr:hypothetical protein [Polynucleobacter sp. MWH-UH25E]QWD62028.1 hypothetical protein ICV39_09880 [Polynucleobacter sp. MWH-UH25E]
MSFFRSRYLLVLMFLLAVILQLLTPFLHAHTGASTQFGLHLHVVNTGFEAAVASEVGKSFVTSSSEESPEVGVPASRQADQIDLIICAFYVLVLFGVANLSLSNVLSPLFSSIERYAHQRYSQNSPPISLASPNYL